MYSSFEEAKEAAIKVINTNFGGDKMGCVVTEFKTKRANRFNFRFYSEDTNGKFVKVNGDLYRMTRI